MKRWRINLIFIFILLFGATLIGRLIYLQVLKHDYYKAMAQGQQKEFQIYKGERGQIFFSGGQVLATNLKGKSVSISPPKIKNKEETARILSETLGLKQEEVLEKLATENLREVLKNNLTEEEENALTELKLPGVYLDQENFREYPKGTMAAQVVGFLGGEEIGQYGVEEYYDEKLQGKERFQKKEKGAAGYLLPSDSEDLNGSDIYLTIDYNIQFEAEKLLKEAKQTFGIEAGLIIVLDPSTGKILALANFPSFDPNKYSEVENFQIFQNGAVEKFYEPGSAFKPFTMASALDQGKITPQTKYTDPGSIQIGKYTIYNFGREKWGERTMTEVLERSINTGAVFAEEQAGDETFLNYVEKFGFFEPTKIDLPGEIYSKNEELKKGYEVNFATASFGQGIEMTPFQLIRAFAAIANGGKLVRPYLVERILSDGQNTEIQPEVSSEQIISQKTVSQLTAMLVSVVENGSAKKTKIPGYFIAGKTGTAQIPWSVLGENRKGYSDKTWQSFLGFAPAFNAKFAVLVKLDNPQAISSEYSAVPIAKDLAKYIIDYLEIPPDYEE